MEQKTINLNRMKINPYEIEEIAKIIEEYKKLNEDGQMQDFLDQAKKCFRCKDLKIEKRPINRILNDLDLKADSEKEATKLIQRYEAFTTHFIRKPNTRIEKSIHHMCINDLSDLDFFKYVTGPDWPEDMGLSIGVCGWTDTGLFLNKSHSKPKIMIVASDWYPLRSQNYFLIEREDAMLMGSGFAKLLFPELASERWRELIEKAGIYFTNAMLCYRPGKVKIGSANLSMRSFKNCRCFLESQIKIVKPDLLISWGVQASSSIFIILAKYAPDSRTVKKMERYSVNPFKELNANKDEFPLQILFGDKNLHFHPLYHPSSRRCHWGEENGNIFQDYSKLKAWIDDNKSKWSDAWI